MGAGEFEPWHDAIDRRLLEGRTGGVLVSPAAAAHEGDETFDRWARMGVEHYERLGVPVSVLPLRTRDDAERDDVVAALDDAALVFFSGGNPWRLSEMVKGTPFWDRLLARLGDGLAYAGCSAGVACLTERTYDSDAEDPDGMFKSGLGTVRGILFAPHWDTVDTWVPGARAFIASTVGPDETLVGIDERTAMVGDGASWDVSGSGAIHLLRDGAWTDLAAGATFELSLGTGGV
jgi:cyanophycinase